MNLYDEIYINRMAQDLIPISEGVCWFSIKTDEEQINILKALCYYIIQGGGNGFDVDKAIIKENLHPVSINTKGRRVR